MWKAALRFVVALNFSVLLLSGATAEAAVSEYTNRGDFEAALSAQIVDDYSHPGYQSGDKTDRDSFDVFTNAGMTAVIGETAYRSTKLDNINIIQDSSGGHGYCAGCNGTFLLDFTQTSLTAEGGVFGVGFSTFYQRTVNEQGLDSFIAYVVFADGSTANYPLPIGQFIFWGLTADKKIATIHLGGPDGSILALINGDGIGLEDLVVGSGGGGPSPEAAIESLVFEGDPAPPAHGFTGGFQDPVTNNDSSLAFSANTTEFGCAGFYKLVGDQISKAICGGGADSPNKVLDGGDGLSFTAIGPRLYHDDGSGLRAVVEGRFSATPTPVPGYEDQAFGTLGQARANDAAQILFWGLTNDSVSGFWWETEGSLEKLVALGDKAPGLGGSAAFTNFGPASHVLSRSGNSAFLAVTSEDPRPGVFAGNRVGELRKVVAPGDAVPGTPNAFLTAGNINAAIIGTNGRGETAFAGTTTGTNENGVWAERFDSATQTYSLHKVILTGDLLSPDGLNDWQPFSFGSVAINDQGSVLYLACSRVVISDTCGIVRATWNDAEGAYDNQVLALDDQLPGAGRDPDGASFIALTGNNHAINARGQVVFRAQADFGDESGARWGIWGWDPGTGLHRIAMDGGPFEPEPGDQREIAELLTNNRTFKTSGGNDGRSRVFNDAGELVFALSFLDNTQPNEGIFRATLPRLPVHELVITAGPSGSPNPVASRAGSFFSVEAEDSEGHDLTYDWTVDCSAWSADDGLLATPNSQVSVWTAPLNDTGSFQHCLVTVTVEDGTGLSETATFLQTVDSEILSGGLDITPSGSIAFVGKVGGPHGRDVGNCDPTGPVPCPVIPYIDYEIFNASNETMTFGINQSEDWLTLSDSLNGGFSVPPTNLAPGESKTIRLTVNEQARRLCVGVYPVTIDFLDLSDGLTVIPRDISLTVTPAESDPPIITPPADVVLEATGLLTEHEHGLVTAVDRHDGFLRATPSTFGPYGLGINVITWEATDCSGNSSQAMSLITVEDTTGPSITVPPPLIIKSNSQNNLVTKADLEGTGPASAEDLVDGAVTPQLFFPPGGLSYGPGQYAIPWIARDSRDNVTTTNQTIAVIPPGSHELIFAHGPVPNPNPAPSGGKARMELSVVDSDGHPLDYDWSDSSSCYRMDDDHRIDPIISLHRTSIDRLCSDSVVVTDQGGGLSERRSFEFWVLAGEPDLHIAPSGKIFIDATSDGIALPSSISLLFENRGSTAIRIEVISSVPWIESLSRETVFASRPERQDLALYLAGLEVGRHMGQIEIRDRDDGTVLETIEVELTVRDATACLSPLVTPPADRVIEAGGPVTDILLDPFGDAFADDPQDGFILPKALLPGYQLLGAQAVEWGAVNSCGAIGVANQVIEIVDTTPPVFTQVPSDRRYEAGGRRTDIALDPVTAVDSVDPNVRVTARIDGSTSRYRRPGSYDVTFTASDFSGNEATYTQKIDIVETVHLVGLETVQVVQDLYNDVTLIENKETYVRVHFENSGFRDSAAFQPALIATRNNLSQTLVPFNYGGLVAPAEFDPDRKDDTISANFFLPDFFQQGDVTLEPVLFSPFFDLDCSDSRGSVGTDCRTTVSFLPAPEMQVTLVSISFQREVGGVVVAPDYADLLEQEQRILAMFPTASIDRRIRYLNLGVVTAEQLEEAERHMFNEITGRLTQFRKDDGCKTTEGCKQFYYGVVADDGGTYGAGGFAHTPGWISSGKVANGETYLRNVSGQELGHNFGMDHSLLFLLPNPDDGVIGRGPCNATVKRDDEPFFPYINQLSGNLRPTIGPLGSNWGRWIYGWDSYQNKIYDPKLNLEVMSYCGFNGQSNWPSDFTYERFLGHLNRIYGPDPSVVSVATFDSSLSSSTGASDFLVVRGRLDHHEEGVIFSPTVTSDSAETDTVTGSGDYDLLAYDEAGSLIEAITFTMNEGGYSPPEPGGHRDGSPDYFDLALPADRGIVEVRIERLGEEIGVLRASPNPPTVEIIAPDGGEFLEGETFDLEWRGRDRDRDDLTYRVQYSADGGLTWTALAVDYRDEVLELPLEFLPASLNGLLRVIASDGFHSASDVSDGPFIVPNKAPIMTLLTPAEGQIFTDDQRIDLHASSFDLEDNRLEDDQVTWHSDQLAQPLGSGHRLTLDAIDLPPGHHLISVVGIDSAGGLGEASVPIRIISGPLPPLEITGLSASPDSLWPVNHELVEVTLAPEFLVLPEFAPATCQISKVSSNDASRGAGKNRPDWEITGDLTLDVRAERSGKGGERIYQVEVTCSGSDGFESVSEQATVEVLVPHDQRR